MHRDHPMPLVVGRLERHVGVGLHLAGRRALLHLGERDLGETLGARRIRLVARDARVVDEHVEAAVAIAHGFEHARDRGGVGDVRCERPAADVLRDAFGARGVEIVDHELRAFGAEALRDRLADPGAATRHECDLAFESRHRRSP